MCVSTVLTDISHFFGIILITETPRNLLQNFLFAPSQRFAAQFAARFFPISSAVAVENFTRDCRIEIIAAARNNANGAEKFGGRALF